MIDYEKRIKNLDEIVKIQCSKGNYDDSVYMVGMANGLILAQSIIKDTKPQFIKTSVISFWKHIKSIFQYFTEPKFIFYSRED